MASMLRPPAKIGHDTPLQAHTAVLEWHMYTINEEDCQTEGTENLLRVQLLNQSTNCRSPRLL